MEEKIEYKKCPYCNLNYIPVTDACCKVCFANSEEARQEAIAQRKKQRGIKIKENCEQNTQQERDNRERLLKWWKSLGFIGFLHTTNFENFVNIYQSGFLKSRKQLVEEGFTFEDNAEITVLERTNELIKSKVRFYYRPITPTNISAYMWHKQKNPVLIVFNENLIYNDNVLFSDGGAGASTTVLTSSADEALKFNWDAIFSVGAFDSNDFVLKNHRNAEFLTNAPLSLENAIKFYFRNYKDYVKACELFGQDERFEYNYKLFY